MLQKKNEGILFSAEIRVVGSYTDRLLSLKLQFNRLLSLTWILSIKMRTFGACGEGANAPRAPPLVTGLMYVPMRF